MSLSVAGTILAAEFILTLAVVLASATPHLRARRIRLLFQIYSGISFWVAYCLAGADESREVSQISQGTIVAIGVLAINAAIFVAVSNALERLQYGSTPASL